MKKIIIYDFDGTLTPYSLPKFEILVKCGYKDGTYDPLFIEKFKSKVKGKNIDLYKAIFDTYLEVISSSGLTLTDDNFSLGSDNVEYNKGVEDFLHMLIENNITNYLLSSGVKVFLEHVSISKYFKDIYATTFTYNKNNTATGVDFLMSDKNKVSSIKEILTKNGITNEDCSSIIYIGDGLTDYYAMKYIKEHNGTSIFVYKDPNNKDLLSMQKENIVDLFTISDFSQDSELYNYIKEII